MQPQAIDIMAQRSPAMISRLVQIAEAARTAGHGGKEAIYQAACAELGISLATLHRSLGEVSVRPKRKRRSDAGAVSLIRKEALLISAALMESHRKKGTKQLLTIESAVDMLRANGLIKAERIDEGSGEIVHLSFSAIARALRGYGLHPEQLLRPSPAKELQSLHPNHVWQIDASVCVLYYLNVGGQRSGLQVMEEKKFNKNKPKNIADIEKKRVISYETTDHDSGAIHVRYVLGAESAVNLGESFIDAIIQRENDPFYGVPLNLMLDMGAAMSSGPFMNFCRRLDIELHPHAAGNARATGQVENARNIIERSFEAGLKFSHVDSLDQLNEQANIWARWYNGTRKHSRHGKTRYDEWLTITQEQLRLAPKAELCRALLTHTPKSRLVSDQLVVEFKGAEYHVHHVPGVMIGESLMVTYNPWREDCVWIVDCDADGNELLHEAPQVVRNERGFREDAHVIGEDYRALPDTQLEKNRKEVELVAMQVETLAEAAALRKAKALPFGGQIDPWKQARDYQAPTYLPKRGTDLPITTRTAEAPPAILNHFQAARALVEAGLVMDTEKNRQIAAWYPDGVPESDIPQLKQRLTVRAGLRVVGE